MSNQSDAKSSGIPLEKIIPHGKSLNGDTIRVRSCTSDAERCQPGDLFIAVDNGSIDGHDEAFQAISNGASAVVVERLIPVDVPQYLVDDTRIALGKICHELAGNPSEQLCTIGVTGTYGKTTTEILTVSILEAANHTSGIIGSQGYCDGMKVETRSHRTPTATDLVNQLSRMRTNGCTHSVIEMSSECLATRQGCGIALDAAVYTNIRRGNLNVHGTVQNYRRATERMVEYLKPKGFAVINADDPGCQSLVAKLDCPAITYSMKHEAEVTATLVERFRGEQTFLLNAGADSIPVRTKIIGNEHIYNCLAAAATALVFDIDLATIAAGLEATNDLPSRMQRIECGQPFGVFVDGAPTTECMSAQLRTLRSVTEGQLFCVVNPSLNQASVERAQMGRILEQLCDETVITESVIGPAGQMPAMHDMLDGFDRPARARLLPNRAKAICWALGEAQPGDSVFIAGGPYNVCCPFSDDKALSFDRDIASYWLRQIGSDKVSPWLTV